MALNDLELVRLKIADKSSIVREEAEGDGQSTHFRLEHGSLLHTPAPQVWNNNSLKVEGTDYTVDYDNGIIIWNTAPVVNDDVVIQYYWSVFTDVEIQAFIDADGGNTTIASAKLLLAVAADAAKIAKRSTLAGGGGLGSVTEDTSVQARELRATAAALLSTESDISSNIPAEGITEIPWTERTFERQIEQDIIRNSS